jgi:uncharacterized membrane protein
VKDAVSSPVWAWSQTKRLLLTTTAATPILTLSVGGRNLAAVVAAYVSVPAGESTTLTLTVAWTDPDTGADSATLADGVELTTNAQFLPVSLLAAAGSVLTVTATAGTANVARCTAVVWGGEL